MKNWQLREEELIEVLPQFLGITFALGFFSYYLHKENLLLIALGVLFLLIIRFRPLLFVGRLLHGTLKSAGRYFTFALLGFLYIVLISPYAFLVRLFVRESRVKFSAEKEKGTSFFERNKTYEKSDFEKVW